MTEKTTKADLIEAIHTNGVLNRKEVHGLIDALFKEIKGAILAGKDRELRGFGTFEVKKRKGRKRARTRRPGRSSPSRITGSSVRPGRELKKGAWSAKPNESVQN